LHSVRSLKRRRADHQDVDVAEGMDKEVSEEALRQLGNFTMSTSSTSRGLFSSNPTNGNQRSETVQGNARDHAQQHGLAMGERSVFSTPIDLSEAPQNKRYHPIPPRRITKKASKGARKAAAMMIEMPDLYVNVNGNDDHILSLERITFLGEGENDTGTWLTQQVTKLFRHGAGLGLSRQGVWLKNTDRPCYGCHTIGKRNDSSWEEGYANEKACMTCRLGARPCVVHRSDATGTKVIVLPILQKVGVPNWRSKETWVLGGG